MKANRNLIHICLLCVMMLPVALQAQFTFITNNNAITITRYTGSNGIVTIPTMTNGYQVTTIGTNAFIGCTFITNIIIPNGIINIEDSAFWGCFGLNNMAVPDSVNSIGNFVFFDCINLNTITLGNNIKTFGFKAFSDCYSLAGINIPDSVTNIEDEAFWDCSGLTSVAIPAGVVHLGDAVFYGCRGLRAILVDENNQGYNSMAGVLFDKNRTTLIQFPEGLAGDYLIPDSVTNIDAFAFGGSILNHVKIPASVQTIGDNAFGQCGALTNVTIPNSVISIGNSSFDDCPWLASVTVGSGVTNIGDYAFAFNLNLASIYFKGNATTNVGPDTFLNDGNTTIYYLPDTIGWSAVYDGLPAVLWNPQAQTGDGNFGVQANQFGFNITGTPDIPIVVEACTNLSNAWVPLQSVSLTNGLFYFSDPQWTNYPDRFYRIRSP